MTVHVITLAFAGHKVLRAAIEAMYRTKSPDLEIKHWVLDQHYPLHYEAVNQVLLDAEELYKFTLLDAGRNLGLHEGFNFVLKRIAPDPGDIVIAYDSDANAVTPGWDMALVTAITAGNRIGWASLFNEMTEGELKNKGFEQAFAGHVELCVLKAPIVNAVCAWRASFLLAAGGLQEPRPFYGHLESFMWSQLQRQNLRWAFLPGYREDSSIAHFQDPEYRSWKWIHAHTQTYDGDFASWLKAGKPGEEPPKGYSA